MLEIWAADDIGINIVGLASKRPDADGIWLQSTNQVSALAGANDLLSRFLPISWRNSRIVIEGIHFEEAA